MIRIGIVGVPGSGKSDLANLIHEHSDRWVTKRNVKIIDDYVEKIEKKTKLALGFSATYVGNLHVALDRAALERTVPKNTKLRITCGTIYETAAYSAQAFETEQGFVNTEDEKVALVNRVEGMMKILACLYMDTYEYDLLIYLRSPAGVSPEVHALDRNLQTALSAFQLDTALTLNDPEEFPIALGVIDDIEGFIQRQAAQPQGAV